MSRALPSRTPEVGMYHMFLKRILYYLNLATLFRRSDPTPEGEEGNVNLRMMHGINRISIFVFLVCLLVMVLRACWG